jgi:hypothetical protein
VATWSWKVELDNMKRPSVHFSEVEFPFRKSSKGSGLDHTPLTL